MTRTFCPKCSFDYTGCSECPYCADYGSPAMYNSWREMATRNAIWLTINIALSLATISVWALIAHGQDRVEYYTLDDGTRVPIVNGEISVIHERGETSYERKTSGRLPQVTRRAEPMNREAREYRPEVRRRPFYNSTRTISALVAAKASLSLTAGYPMASTSIDARVAGSRGDTKP